MLTTSGRPPIRWGLLVLLLLVELIAITSRFEVHTLLLPAAAGEARWPVWLFYSSKDFWQVGLWISTTCLLILTPKFRVLCKDLPEYLSGYRWSIWLVFHVLAFAGFFAISTIILEKPVDPARLSALWFAAWFVLASMTVLLWLFALAPSRFWLRLMRQEWSGVLIGSLLGMCAWVVIRPVGLLALKEPWDFLSGWTLRLVYSLVGWVYSDLVYQPEQRVVGTPAFPVEIHYQCSGIEGIVLITLFLAIYLWLFRKELRFPQAFWLFPIGMIAIWLANVVRIATLIVIGSSFSPEIALRGFHQQAGWIAFTVIAVGAIALSHKMQFFTVTNPSSMVVRNNHRLAVGLLTPFLVLMATSMVTSTASSGFETLYPLKVLATAVALWYFRNLYYHLGWGCSWRAAGLGAVVFVIWMLLEPPDDHSNTALAQGLEELPAWAAVVWMVFRMLGSVITVPLAEELAFRVYLIRKLVAEDFENVSPRRFTGLSFIGSSILFGLMHGRWLGGTLAGMAYALALYRRGQLGDALIAHVTTNALIAFWVITQGRWNLWS